MVNAGVYLVARTNPIFATHRQRLVVGRAIGIFTAILAASIAMTQTDIKRVLAYSTLSQLGYMFAALGVGAWTAAIFHLMTHGFFKGLLFLGSGSVIHSVHEEQDMRRMGGLSQKIRSPTWTMYIGSLAIAGIPPLAGFFSKDEILGESLKDSGSPGSGRRLHRRRPDRPSYMFRLMGLTFGARSAGRARYGTRSSITAGHDRSPDPAGDPLRVPGDVRRPAARRQPDLHWLEPIFAEGEAILHGGAGEPAYQLFGIDGALIIASVTIATIGMILAWRLFGIQVGPIRMPSRPERVRELTAACRSSTAPRSTSGGSTTCTTCCSWSSADGSRRRSGGSTARSSTAPSTPSGGDHRRRRGLRQVQTGRVQNYALGIAIGLIVMAGSYLCWRALTMDDRQHPAPVDHHLPAARRALVVAIAPATLGAPVALGFAL
jgi:hypothetical protein